MVKSLSDDLRWRIIYCQAEGLHKKKFLKKCILVKLLLIKYVEFSKNGDV